MPYIPLEWLSPVLVLYHMVRTLVWIIDTWLAFHLAARRRVRVFRAPPSPVFDTRVYYTVCFINGSDEKHEFVKSIVGRHYHAIDMSVRFKFLEVNNWDGPCAIRIIFTNSGVSWCRLGILKLSGNESFDGPTMSLNLNGRDQDDNQATVLHEFGHALGLLHQHQHPDSGIEWNEAELKRRNPKLKGNWIHRQYTDKIRSLAFMPYDRDSIMHYDVDLKVAKNLTKPIPINKVLSEGDKKLLLAMYPPRTHNIETSGLSPGAIIELKAEPPLRQERQQHDT
ncbi:acetylcholinesterase [Apiospora arundinis]